MGNTETLLEYFLSLKKMVEVYEGQCKNRELESSREVLDVDYIFGDSKK